MNVTVRPALFFCVMITFYLSALSQQTAARDSAKKVSFRFNAEYLSNYIYNGRADSLKSPYLISTIEMDVWNGFSLSASLNYLPGKNSRVDLVTVDASYEHDFTKYFTCSLYASKYFNSNQRTTVNSSLGGSIGAGGQFTVSNFRFFTEADLYFGTARDLFLYTELSKEWMISMPSIDWTITPSIGVNASTLGYYGGSVTKNTIRKSRRTGTAPVSIIKSTSVLTPGFRLMDLEYSLPTGFESAHFGVLFTVTWAIPMHPVTTTSEVTRGTVTTTVVSTPYPERNLKPRVFTDLLLFVKF